MSKNNTNLLDTYFFLLERPSMREFGLAGEDILYQTKSFDLSHYERASGVDFEDYNTAYKHWLQYGRSLGLSFNCKNNTLLKIILKAKDEPELIEKWIEHHSAIVGDSNLIILDCGSTDPEYKSILERYKKSILIMSYNKYYDYIHNISANVDFFNLISKNCKYVTILDADEFLFGFDGTNFSCQNIVSILENATDVVLPGIWINNAYPPAFSDGKIVWGQPILLNSDTRNIENGIIAGKAVIRSDSLLKCKHLGHNMHTKEVLHYLTPQSFGKIAIIHLSILPEIVSTKRITKHLIAMGVLPETNESYEIDIDKLKEIQSGVTSPVILGYVNKLLAIKSISHIKTSHHTVPTRLLASESAEILYSIGNFIKTFDYEKLIKLQLSSLA